MTPNFSLSARRLSAMILPFASALLLMTPALHADTVMNYNVSGSIPSAIFSSDGATPIAASTLSGSVQIDQTTGTLNADLFLAGGVNGEYLASSSSPDFFYNNLIDVFAFDPSADPSSSSPSNAFPILDILLPGDAFSSNGVIPIVTYSNAGLFEDSTNVGFFVGSTLGQGEGQIIQLTSGSLTPADNAPVPEPESVALVGTGLASLAACVRRLRRA